MSAVTQSGWPADRLKDVAEVNRTSLGAGTPADYEFRYLEISNVNSHGVISEAAIEDMAFEQAPTRARRRVKDGDVLVSSVRPNLQAIAHVTQAGDHLVCSTGFNVVTPISWKLESRFLYYFLLSEGIRQHFEAVSKGVGYPALDDKDFGSTQVPLPTLPEQQRIVAYLDWGCEAIDRAVEAKKKQVETLAVTRDSIVQQAVTQGLNPGVEMKESGVEWLGLIPRHWRAQKLKRLFKRVDYGISASTEQEGNHPVLKMGNIVQGEVVFSNMGFVDDVDPDLFVEHNDLLFNRTNSLDQVAKVAIFRGQGSRKVTFASYLVRLRPNHKNDPRYLNYLVNTDAFLGLARKMAIPSVQQANLNPTRYCQLEVPVPPLTEQIDIWKFLDEKTGQIRQSKEKLASQISTLTAYRRSLIHECVTGKRRISEADIPEVGAHV